MQGHLDVTLQGTQELHVSQRVLVKNCKKVHPKKSMIL